MAVAVIEESPKDKKARLKAAEKAWADAAAETAQAKEAEKAETTETAETETETTETEAPAVAEAMARQEEESG